VSQATGGAERVFSRAGRGLALRAMSCWTSKTSCFELTLIYSQHPS